MKHNYTKLPKFEFHINRRARDDFQFEDSFFSIQGDVVFANFRAAQLFAETIRQKQKLQGITAAEFVQASHLHAMGLLHEVFHFVIERYRRERNPDLLSRCDEHLKKSLGKNSIDGFLTGFVNEFPPLPVYHNSESAEHYLQHETAGLLPKGWIPTNRHAAYEELLLVWLQNQNPGFKPIAELVDDRELGEKTIYKPAIKNVSSFLETQPTYGPDNQSLVKMLLAPSQASPDSIMGQLEFVVKNWAPILSNSPLFMKLLGAMDFIREEGKYLYMRAQAEADRAKIPFVVKDRFGEFGEKESALVPSFKGSLYEVEPERFSTDLAWMPNLVLIAKNIFVWLDQLSKKYQRHISRLDEIPDEELDILSQRGFTGLWLIGIWERSRASERVKRFSGNPEALASAYSLNDYTVSPELGGEGACYNLRNRAMQRGIRLASDMVPNHMGIDSSWVLNHPDWFIQTDYPPFPNYSFTGPDLSDNDRVGIFIEDGYWRKSDAAVVFKRLDRWTGDVKYIYHGNDGTHMPWNDTAQLNFLKPEVREAVIQTILHVARLFPVIRFDAAMVLSKKHYQRLWFPEPGTGGAIPSRAAFSMTRGQIDAQMPEEFWRELVDRIQREAPDTLLLAEAFWLMEGYFVRTLGMHRVYNSAFMNMLKKEENANYRTVMKNVLEYNPQILKRFVNFMNNPDEDSAIAQFGKDDKYFGACVMMSTLPGLPMFGHGQVEGFSEKYGMEYRRAYYDEQADQSLMLRHEREIFPLLKRRYLFAEAGNFLLYDFFTTEGMVNEDVFAYSNRVGTERALIVFNNKFSHTSGWIRSSVGFINERGTIIQKTLGDGLALGTNADTYCIFQDKIAGLEFIRRSSELWEKGLFVELGAFKYHVFMNFHEVTSTREKPYDRLKDLLAGRGVPSVEEALSDMLLKPIHLAFKDALSHDCLQLLKNGIRDDKNEKESFELFNKNLRSIVEAVKKVEPQFTVPTASLEKSGKLFRALLQLVRLSALTLEKEKWANLVRAFLPLDSQPNLQGWRIIFAWLYVRLIEPDDSQRSPGVNPIEQWKLKKVLLGTFAHCGAAEQEALNEVELLSVLSGLTLKPTEDVGSILHSTLADQRTRDYLLVNLWDGKLWFNKERHEELVKWIFILASIDILTERTTPAAVASISAQFQSLTSLLNLAATSGYELQNFIEALPGEGPTSALPA